MCRCVGISDNRLAAFTVSLKSPLSEGLCVRTLSWAGVKGHKYCTDAQYGPTKSKNGIVFENVCIPLLQLSPGPPLVKESMKCGQDIGVILDS